MADARISRVLADVRGLSTLAAGPETRLITLAQGIQFNNSDLAPWPYMVIPNGLMVPTAARAVKDSKGQFLWPNSMRARAPLAITVISSTQFEFLSTAQNVKFVVTIVNKKDEYVKALQTSGMHVIYDGHARYGRGPCFGDNDAPGEDWENGSDPKTKGLFRMGYPFIGVPVKEVKEHGYTADLVSSSVKVTLDQSEPDLKPFVSSLRAKTATEIDPALPAQVKDKDPTKTWWTYQAMEEGKLEPFVVLNAGWTGTASAPADLGAVTPACKVFCHFGCDTFKHNQKILRSDVFKGWKNAGDDRFAFFTTSLSDSVTAHYWLYHLFTHPTKNAFAPWEPSITYALNHTNADLRMDGNTFQLI